MTNSITPTSTRPRRMTGKACVAAMALAVSAALPLEKAHAGATVSFGEDKSISLGLGMRSSFTSVENGAPNGTSRSSDFALNSIRIYMGASLTKEIKGTFNTERDGAGNIKLLDGYAQFEFADEFNVWVGRMLPPSDRANLDGPYYLSAWDYPAVSQYPAIFAGRDDGITVWGKVADKKLVYAFGVFMGHNRGPGLSNAGDNMLYTGRIAYNFLDAEPDPAYYTSSTYYGSNNILTLAVDGMYQKDGVGTALLKRDYKSWSADLLFEKPIAGVGTVTLEGAYYDYGTGAIPDPGSAAVTNSGGLVDGKGYLVEGAFMFPDKVGWGFVQPYVRYQKFDFGASPLSASVVDGGVNYVISGHNARITAAYTSAKTNVTSALDKFTIGLQLQF